MSSTPPDEIKRDRNEPASRRANRLPAQLARFPELANAPHVFVRPQIPRVKLSDARSSYARLVAQEQPLVLVDGSNSGSAKTGMLITTAGIWARSESLGCRGPIPWDAISSVGCTGKTLSINSSPFAELAIADYTVSLLANLISALSGAALSDAIKVAEAPISYRASDVERLSSRTRALRKALSIGLTATGGSSVAIAVWLLFSGGVSFGRLVWPAGLLAPCLAAMMILRKLAKSAIRQYSMARLLVDYGVDPGTAWATEQGSAIGLNMDSRTIWLLKSDRTIQGGLRSVSIPVGEIASCSLETSEHTYEEEYQIAEARPAPPRAAGKYVLGGAMVGGIAGAAVGAAVGSMIDSARSTMGIRRKTIRTSVIYVDRLALIIRKKSGGDEVFTYFHSRFAAYPKTAIKFIPGSAAARKTVETLAAFGVGSSLEGRVATDKTSSETGRRAAVRKCTDPAVLAEISRTDSDPDVRRAAEERLKEVRAGNP